MSTTALVNLKKGLLGIITKIIEMQPNDAVTQRLSDLGFAEGEIVKITATTPFKKGPLVVKLGMSQFALRYQEAARIFVMEAPHQ